MDLKLSQNGVETVVLKTINLTIKTVLKRFKHVLAHGFLNKGLNKRYSSESRFIMVIFQFCFFCFGEVL